MSSITVLSWNLGTDKAYQDILDRGGKERPEDENVAETRTKVAKTAFKTLIESHLVDIICLQNVGNDLARIKSWLGEEFEIKSAGKDTAVAYRCRFEYKDSICHTGKNHNYTILTLKDRLTQKVYVIGSVYLCKKSDNYSVSTDLEILKTRSKSLNDEIEGTILVGCKAIDHDSEDNPLLFRINSQLQELNTFTREIGNQESHENLAFLQDPTNNPSPYMPVIKKLALTSNTKPKSNQEEEEEEEEAPRTAFQQSGSAPASSHDNESTSPTAFPLSSAQDPYPLAQAPFSAFGCIIKTMAVTAVLLAIAIPFYASFYNIE